MEEEEYLSVFDSVAALKYGYNLKKNKVFIMHKLYLHLVYKMYDPLINNINFEF